MSGGAAARGAEFSLLETLRYEPRAGFPDGFARLDRHLDRLAASARHFGFADPTAGALRALRGVAAALAGESRAAEAPRWRVRVVADRDGRADATRALLPADASRVRTAAVARTPVDRDDVFLQHSTTHRAAYDARRVEWPYADDVLLWNREGELTEFTAGSLVLELGGRRWTPPRACGLLGGVFRAELLERGLVGERVLRPGDLEDAGAGTPRVWLVSSLRGWVPIALVDRA